MKFCSSNNPQHDLLIVDKDRLEVDFTDGVCINRWKNDDSFSKLEGGKVSTRNAFERISRIKGHAVFRNGICG